MAPSQHGERVFKFCIDRGGTFTDVYAEVPGEPGWYVEKLLSVDPANYADAPREGIRRILEKATGEKIPRGAKVPTARIEWIRMGTTVATNALLERKGERTALCITEGFRDLLFIGNQARPNIFDLKVARKSPLYERVVEVRERLQLVQDRAAPCADAERMTGTSGEEAEVLVPLDKEHLRTQLQALLDDGIRSLAVCLLHSYNFPAHEQAVVELARSMGFRQVSSSAELVPMVRVVPRGHTTVVDAYLTPPIQDYLSGFLSGFDEGLKDVNVSFMQSDGGLTPAAKFSGFKAILSGPAGGVVGYGLTSFGQETKEPVIGFDMGGTSTDVSRYAGSFEQVLEMQIAGVIIQAPQLDINTVAAGGGSKLHFQAGVFKVGPDSVGAAPGPVCYCNGGQLAVTDANLLLGRVLPNYFPKIFGPSESDPLDVRATRAAFEGLAPVINAERRQMDSGVEDMTVEEVALGFLSVANEAMCRPIRQLTEMKGHETAKHVLACFGGAGPQHGCSIARALKIRAVLVHRYCGILSAYGMGLADVTTEAQSPCADPYTGSTMGELDERVRKLRQLVQDNLRAQGFEEKDVAVELLLNLRYEGTDTAIMVPPPSDGKQDYGAGFVKQFRKEYGFELKNRRLIVDDIRVRGTGRTNLLKPVQLERAKGDPEPEDVQHQCYFQSGWRPTLVYMLEKLLWGHRLPGPAVIMNGTSTILVEPQCTATITEHGNVWIDVAAETEGAKAVGVAWDVVRLSIFGNRFMGIAEQMGRTLQRTSISTNIKERLDFSCALFSPDGGLVANAPHVPVHLGAMSSTVRWQLQHWGDKLEDGDVLVTNHPACGGSHLPDITVVTPVFHVGRPIFFVANRGHHAEIGGVTPGSMPPFSKSLAEEGAAIKAFKLVEKGEFQEEGIRAILEATGRRNENDPDRRGAGDVIPGTRRIADNLSDLRAQVAANQRGIDLIGELIAEYSLEVVQAYMSYVQENAEVAVRKMLKKMARAASERKSPEQRAEGREDDNMVLVAEDRMDDGSCIKLTLTIDAAHGEAHFDFAGTGPEVYGNWNAPEAVTAAAIIYCVRCLVDEEIPLNQGCLAPVTISIPKGSFLSPCDRAAVVGGNVLTSQRITDVVLSAFQACANSQGCMNNLTFGDDTFGYYETIGGGSGAGPDWAGTSGLQCHMTNTRITDPEILERRYPVRLCRFGLREGSGGRGAHDGGDGIVREILFRRPVTVSILSERRAFAPHGMFGGQDGQRGINRLCKADGLTVALGGKNTILAQAGDVLQLYTPGGGGWGSPQNT